MAVTGTAKNFSDIIVHGARTTGGFTTYYKDDPTVKVSFTVTAERTSNSSASVDLKFSNISMTASDKFDYYIRAFVSKNSTDVTDRAALNGADPNDYQTGTKKLITAPEEVRSASGWTLTDSDMTLTYGNLTDNTSSITIYLKTQAGCNECESGGKKLDTTLGTTSNGENVKDVGYLRTTNSFTIAAADIPDYWTSITKGEISITDNGNNTFTVSGKNGKGGFNNALESGTLNTTLGIEGVSFSLVDVDTNDALAGKTDEDKFSRTYKISDPDNKIGDAGVIKVTSTITNVPSQSTDGTVVAKDEKVIKFYKVPNPPTSIWYVSNGKSSASDGTFEPRLKKELSWRWTGASSGNSSSSITGYKIYIYKNEVVAGASGTAFNLKNPSSEADTSITNEPSDKGTPGHKIETTLTINTRLNFKFIPKDEGFVNNDKCICRVFSATTWGDNSIHYSTTGVLGECTLKNGAVVWVRTPKSSTDSTLVWKEGTVYVYHEGRWQEAEGVYVRSGGQWKEST